MKNSNIVKVLESLLYSSEHPEKYDDNIQPSLRKMYDGDKLAASLITVIAMLKIQDSDK